MSSVRGPRLLRLERSRSGLTVLGVVMVSVLIGAALVVVASFRGSFSDKVALYAQLPSAGNDIELNTPVEYRDVTVGQVASQGQPVGHDLVLVKILIDPKRLVDIPRGVRATVGPATIFGSQYVQLQPPAAQRGVALRAGMTIPSYTNLSPASLQTTLTNFDDLLVALHPAELDSALTAVATALRGQGTSLGASLHEASLYLGQTLPLLPTFESDLSLIAPFANQIAQSTPALLGFLANTTVTSQTFTTNDTALRQLLVGGAALSGVTATIFDAVQQPFITLVNATVPFLADVNQSPTELSATLAGLAAWSQAWTAAESQGPYLSLSTSLAVPNAADVVLAGLGDPDAAALFADGIGNNLVNPPTYSSAQRPVYPFSATDLGGTSAASRAATASAVRATENRVPTDMPEPATTNAVAAITTGLDGAATSQATSAVATLLLGPVLHQIVTGSAVGAGAN